MRTFKIADTEIRIINIGDIVFTLKEQENVPESEWRPKYSELFERKLLFPSQSVLFSSPGSEKVLVDAGDYYWSFKDSTWIPPNYVPPPSLAAQLESNGVAPEEIKHVIITHAHFDHYSGVTTKKKHNEYMPTFPEAKYYLGQADWKDPRTQKELQNPGSKDSLTLGVLDKQGMLELVHDKKTVTKNIEIIPSPGESPGHQIVKFLSSGGEALYCLGDLFHHPVEIENISWMAPWDDPEINIDSRRKLIEAALKEDALLLAAHMDLGKLWKDGPKVRFVER